MLNRTAALVILSSLLCVNPAVAQNGPRPILPKLKVQTAQCDIGKQPQAAAKRPPIILHVTKNMPIMHSLAPSTPGSAATDQDDVNPLYSKSALTVIKEKNTPQGLDISFIGPPDTTRVTDYDTETTAIAGDGPGVVNAEPQPNNRFSSNYGAAGGMNPYMMGAYMGNPGALPSYVNEVPAWGFNFVGTSAETTMPGLGGHIGSSQNSDIYDNQGDNYSSGDIYDRMMF